ncbi:hypothetical protein LCGC14_2036560 [marine sediment metagenome]|uniref:NAD-specific glutamate dehydrogenase n=1 Tax=marine sediment metagenome TaxID=412755 RepID=A0A0F9ET39_9ZZZZ
MADVAIVGGGVILEELVGLAGGGIALGFEVLEEIGLGRVLRLGGLFFVMRLDTLSGGTLLRLSGLFRHALSGQRLGHAAARDGDVMRLVAGIDPGGDDADAHPAGHAFVEGRADDDVRVAVDLLADDVRGFVQLEQREVVTAGDVDENALGTVEADLVQQRIGDGLLGGLLRAIFALGFARAHHRLAHLVHHGADIGKVEVDEARTDHQVGHALDALIEHVVGQREGFGERGLFVGETEQVLVRNDDQRIDHLLKGLDALLGLAHALAALELEGLGHDADGQNPKLARGLGDDRGRTGAGAAAHAGIAGTATDALEIPTAISLGS